MIGVDLVSINRIKEVLERFSDKFLEKILSKEEIATLADMKIDSIRAKEKKIKRLAGFWAAKEACAKALGTGIGQECKFYDIKLYKTGKGAPKIELSERLREKFGIKDISVSITHDGDYAIAVVAIENRL